MADANRTPSGKVGKNRDFLDARLGAYISKILGTKKCAFFVYFFALKLSLKIREPNRPIFQ